jgi:hypothetical protein
MSQRNWQDRLLFEHPEARLMIEHMVDLLVSSEPGAHRRGIEIRDRLFELGAEYQTGR